MPDSPDPYPSCEVGDTFTHQGQQYQAEAASDGSCRGCAFLVDNVPADCSAPKTAPSCRQKIFIIAPKDIPR